MFLLRYLNYIVSSCEFKRKIMLTDCILIICGLISFIAIYFPSRHARHYDCIEATDALEKLHFQPERLFHFNHKNCTYHDIMDIKIDVDIDSIHNIRKFIKPEPGGEFNPYECNSLIKIAVIVPYKNRGKQKAIFLNYMHHFLQQQKIHYRIFIAEQNNTHLFNRANLLNNGAKVAMILNYPCLILHDIDLIPLNLGNLYGCTQEPRHMSSSLDKFRYNLPYLTLFGGAVSILSEQFKLINGMSNAYHGWGGEDDNFFKRLEYHNIKPCRYCASVSKYSMLSHKKQKPSSERYSIHENSMERHLVDGLNSLSNNYTMHLKDLYTHIIIS